MSNTGCVVPKCSGKGGHQFPRDKDLKAWWVHVIRRDHWTPRPTSLFCRRHFKPSDYKGYTSYGTSPSHRFLKPGTVPSIFAWTSEISKASVDRNDRAQRRQEDKAKQPDLSDIGLYEEVGVDCEREPAVVEGETTERTTSTACQTETHELPPICIECFQDKDDAIHDYTGGKK